MPLVSAMGLLKLGEEIFEAWKPPFPAQMGNLCSSVYTIMGQSWAGPHLARAA